MMTRLVLFRTFIALCVCAGMVAGGIILWSLAPVIDEVRQPATTVAAATTSLDALPERLPPVRLEPPGEADGGWRLSQFPAPDVPGPLSDVTGALDEGRSSPAPAAAAPVPQPPRPAVSRQAEAPAVPAQPSQAPPVTVAQAPAVRVIPLGRTSDDAAPPVIVPRPAAPPVPPTSPSGFAVVTPPAAAAPEAPAPVPAAPVSPRQEPPAAPGVTQTPPTTPAPASAPPAVAAVEPEADDDLVDLNTGSLEQLNSLKGGGRIGRAIIQARPYRSVEDLLRKKVLTRSTFERIRDQVTVR